MVGVGLVTYNNPGRFVQCWPTIWYQLIQGGVVDYACAYEDGSSLPFRTQYQQIADEMPAVFPLLMSVGHNLGVGVAKNVLLRRMLAAGCDELFLCEDDMIILDPKAVTEYVRVGHERGLHHLSFALHGPMNKEMGPVEVDGDVTYWPAGIGAWSYYTREGLEKVGLHDERFFNAFEHLDLTYRFAAAGLTSPFWRFADVTGSERWISEQPDAMETSTHRGKANWFPNLMKNKAIWNSIHPECPL